MEAAGAGAKANFLSDHEMEQIMARTFEVLESVGVRVLHPEALQTLKEHGAEVDGAIARIPQSLVERAVATAPRRFLVAGRTADLDIFPGDGRIYVQGNTGPESILDVDGTEPRKVILSDIVNWAKLIDSLPHIDCYAGPFPSDVPVGFREVYVARQALEYCRKPLYLQIYSVRAAAAILEMAAVVAGGRDSLRQRPLVTFSSTVISPLVLPKDDLEVLLYAGQNGVPCGITTIPIAGASSPVTIAGNLVLTLAEELAGLTVAQCAHPGTPNFLTPKMMVMDMRSGLGRQGSVEFAVYSAAFGQIANRYIGVPLNLNGTGCDSHVPDLQAQIERVLNATMSAMGGAAFMCSAGKLETSQTVSLVQLVIDNEIWGLLKRLNNGVRVTDDTMAVDAIRRVGPGGNFLNDDHTFKYFREMYVPPLWGELSRTKWSAADDLWHRALRKVEEIVNGPAAGKLDDHTCRQLDEIIEQAGIG